MFIKTLADITLVPVGYTWESKPMRIGFLRFISAMLISGDWNKVHINPLTSWLYESNLGGLTCCGDLVTLATSGFIHQALRIGEDVELVSPRKSALFKRPLHPRTKFRCRYTLMERAWDEGRGRAACVWKVELLDMQDSVLDRMEWSIHYVFVERSTASVLVTLVACYLLVAVYGWTNTNQYLARCQSEGRDLMVCSAALTAP